MGYKEIIFTLYRCKYPDDQVERFAGESDLLAVAMTIDRALTDLPKRLKKIGVPTLTHTVNDHSLLQRLYDNGVFGVFTDNLLLKVDK